VKNRNYIFNNFQKTFLKDGYCIFDIKNKTKINYLKDFILECSKKVLKLKKFDLDNSHKYISKSTLNRFRLSIINQLNKDNDFILNYFEISEDVLNQIIGNEIAMQNEISLSIQLPNDNSSLLPMHADTWSGNSPFEVVIWIPLVDVYKSKSMFILKNSQLKKFNNYFHKNKVSAKSAFKKFEKDFQFLKINFGQGLIFNQNLPHGNVLNKTRETRWSMNCRFKSLFSPYNFKKFGEVFKPVNIKPASLLGINYNYPNKTDENF
jgi:sporadic carbohydrate cluster 2OG-Fe(II) oxygenase